MIERGYEYSMNRLTKRQQAEEADDLFRSDPYFKYTPLPKGHIRLLKIDDIELGWADEKLEHTFSVSFYSFPAHSCPNYDALSYTWGSPTPLKESDKEVFTTVERCYPIYSAGRLLRGTRNLRGALGRLRQMQSVTEDQIVHTPDVFSDVRVRYGIAQFY
jgi:hypothetical protein